MTEIKNGLPIIHPGEMLRELFIDEVCETKDKGVKDISEKTGIPVSKLKCFIRGEVDVTEDLAEKLATGLKTSKELWLNFQKTFDEKYLASTEEVIVRVPVEIAQAFNEAKKTFNPRVIDQLVAELIKSTDLIE